jgi:hypothetical protein
MTSVQQAAYWKHQARKHEDRVKAMANYDELKSAYDKYQELLTASQTEQEKAVAAARQAGAQEAMAQVGGQLVEQWFRSTVAGRLDDDRVNTILDGLDRRQFLGQNGSVDADKVRTFVEMLIPAQPAASAATSVPEAGQQPAAPAVNPALAPAPPRLPDFGQGAPARSRPSGLEAGREIARARFGQKPATTNAHAAP